MGYRQAVRHKTLTLARDSSNLSTPANMVDIVQSVERQIVDLVVAGSSPVIHPIKKRTLLCDFFYFLLQNQIKHATMQIL